MQNPLWRDRRDTVETNIVCVCVYVLVAVKKAVVFRGFYLNLKNTIVHLSCFWAMCFHHFYFVHKLVFYFVLQHIFIFPNHEAWIYTLACCFFHYVNNRRKGEKALCLSQSLSIMGEINSPYKPLIMPLDRHSYNYCFKTKTRMGEEPGVLARERKQVPWPHNTMRCYFVQTCWMCSFIGSHFLVL